MRFIDFFAGIGGARRGMELAGNICAGFCEVDNFATAAYTSMHLITDEQRKYLATLPKHKRQKEILKSEYRNGEWYSDDVRRLRGRDLPVVECWCFGAPCQDFSITGLRAGLGGDKSSLVRDIFRLIGEVGEENKPEWLIYENVKGMLSSNRGLDFAFILAELDECGYDAEWAIFNSKNYGVPQNRERVYLIGHLRAKGRCRVFPVEVSDRENSVQINLLGHRDGYRRNSQVFSPEGIMETLDTCGGGGSDPHVAVSMDKSFVDLTTKAAELTDTARCIKARYDNGVSNLGGDKSGVAIFLSKSTERRLDTGCNQGVLVNVDEDTQVYAVWHEGTQSYIAIRKLTPKECFRLQGWTDDYFEKAAFINSDSQLYKEAGNGITVNVIHAIAEMIKEVNCENS